MHYLSSTFFRILGIAFIVALATLTFPAVTKAAFEHVQLLNADIVFKEDSSMEVVETITYLFIDERHGIYREIPTTHPDPASNIARERYIDVQIKAVTLDGAAVPYTVDAGRTRVLVKIGDPNETIVGEHTYTIAYDVQGAVSYPKNGGADLYWNVTGNNWDFPIKEATARVSSPDGVFTRERACYKGAVGLLGSCDSVVEEEGGAVVFTAQELSRGDGFTFARAINRSVVEKVILERWKLLWFWIPLMLAWFIGLGVWTYRYKFANETGRTIIPQYEPYPGVKPMYAGLLFDGSLDARDITACVVYLAEQDFISIRKVDRKVLFFFEVDDYEVTLKRPLESIESAFERSILTLLFANDAIVGTKVTLSDLKNDVTGQKANYYELVALRQDLEKDLEKEGFFEMTVSKKAVGGALVGALALTAFVAAFIVRSFPVPFFLFGITLILSLGILSFASRRRTKKGFEALDHLKGFKEFLSVTEKERYDFHNAPEKSPQQFMEYLPYAIAFGVEEKWAEVFKDITIPNPEWYDGGNVSTFNAMNLTSSLGAFSGAFASAATPTSSASSGGGFSGGGAGGGGGGSW